MCTRRRNKEATYSYGGEDILELVHEGNQPWIVHVDATDRLAIRNGRGCPGACAYAFGFVAIVGEVEGGVLDEFEVYVLDDVYGRKCYPGGRRQIRCRNSAPLLA